MCARPANVNGTGKDSYERTDDESSNAVQGRGVHGFVHSDEPVRTGCGRRVGGNSAGKRFAANEAAGPMSNRVYSSTARRRARPAAHHPPRGHRGPAAASPAEAIVMA